MESELIELEIATSTVLGRQPDAFGRFGHGHGSSSGERQEDPRLPLQAEEARPQAERPSPALRRSQDHQDQPLSSAFAGAYRYFQSGQPEPAVLEKFFGGFEPK